MSAEIRMNCMGAAALAKRKIAGLRISEQEIAKHFAYFCEGDKLRWMALEQALSEANNRATIDQVLSRAQQFVDFATEKPPAQATAPKADPTPKRSTKRKFSR